MKVIIRDATTDVVSDRQTREARGLASFLVDGILRVRETSSGAGAAATVNWYNLFTGELVDSVTVASGEGKSGQLVKVPYQYRLEVVSLVNGAVIDAGIDGDV